MKWLDKLEARIRSWFIERHHYRVHKKLEEEINRRRQE